MPKKLELKFDINLDGAIEGIRAISYRFKSGRQAGLYIDDKRISLVLADISAGKLKSVKEKSVDLIDAPQDNADGTSTIKNRDDRTIEALKRLFEGLDAKPSCISLAIPDRDAVVRFMKLPRLPKSEWAQAISFESKRYIPFEEKDTSIFHKVILPKGDLSSMNVVLVAAKKSSIDRLIHIIERAGIDLNVLEVASFSIIRLYAFSGQMDKEAATAIVHIGADKDMSVIITNATVPYITRDVSLKEKEVGLAESIIGEIRRTSIYYSREFSGQFIGKVILCGEADFTGLDDAISKELKVPVVIGDVKPAGAGLSARLAVPFGLSLKGLVKMEAEPQFIQGKKKIFAAKETLVDEVNRPLIATVSAIQAAIFFLVIFFSHSLSGKEAKLFKSRLDTIYAQRPAISDAYYKMSEEELAATVKAEEFRFSYLRNVTGNRIYWSEIMSVLARLTPKGLWFSKIIASDIMATDTSGKPFSRSFVLDGTAYSEDKQKQMQVVNEFLEILKRDGRFGKLFPRVELGTVYGESVDNDRITKFGIKCYN
ncbi:MAG: hypothetical protein AUJ75_02840 [Candidatus Omnitrophica bacterium CG1_02_49_10]|nr:MAG: hypothetical protein AUJ75_02840 [Candidatus Omnitrophica bacterium CG1_02_49_10]